MKVFLTGATGFLGKYVLNQLLKDGHTVRALARSPQSLANINNIEVVEGDITVPESLKGKLRGCDAVMHLAGAVGYSYPLKYFINTNINGTKNVVTEAVASGIRRFIHCSSVSVYGRVSGVNLFENAPFRKINDPYGDTKIEAEKVLRGTEDKLDLTIFRPTVIIGNGEKFMLPALAERIKSGIFKIIGDGNNTITLIHACDAARAICMVLENKNTFGKTYNLSDTDNLSVNELIDITARTIGYKEPIKHIPYNVAYIAAWLMELIFAPLKKTPPMNRFAVRILGLQYNYMTDAIRKDLGFEPEMDIRKGIVESLT